MSLKLGVIGAGAIGKEHIRRCTQVLQGATVVAVSDINADNARAAVALPGVQAEVYADGHDVINASDVDAILVTSWDPTHEEYTLAAIAAGKPVFCEKPLAMSAEGCRRIVDAEMKAGRRLVQVGFMRPYDEGYLALKKVIDDGDIGAPLMLRCAHRNQSVGENYTTDMAITNTLIHELDVLRWLLNDDYRSVQVRFPRSTSHTHARLKDPQIVSFETKKGTLIDVEVFVNCQYGYDIQCEVVGENRDCPSAGAVCRPDAQVRQSVDRHSHRLERPLYQSLRCRAAGLYQRRQSWPAARPVGLGRLRGVGGGGRLH
ncbi:putative NADH-dependent dehydrogenase [Klebsiella aerogenes]|nr:putative NADH-dependent dehydrogenase [Klebsiella aerogenes]